MWAMNLALRARLGGTQSRSGQNSAMEPCQAKSVVAQRRRQSALATLLKDPPIDVDDLPFDLRSYPKKPGLLANDELGTAESDSDTPLHRSKHHLSSVEITKTFSKPPVVVQNLV